ncbi:putative aminotransferase class I and II [Colletotrichum sublineola]|uniref:Aspartate aminotransferase n=1 Tax=Colletotrichum sublineola TaxID=1173701 RepID=A0A066XI87_COLSU|nr:putative aminotransferase class I and II [Colletotrichum sublineola]
MGSIEKRTSAFERSEFIPPDAIFDVTRRYVADTNPDKVNLGQGTYRDGDGQPWILPSVRLAEESLGTPGHEYLPIAGLKSFRDEAVKLVFGTTKAFAENRIASCQSLSGTGALLLAGLALKRAATGITTVCITDPTWSNHELLFRSLGFEVRQLPYYKDRAFDFDGYMAALESADTTCAVVLHACAHNPTGSGRFPRVRLGSAYLGFNSGSVDDDAWAIRYFVDELGLEAAVCLSFAKNMGLYGERVGAVTFVAGSEDRARTVGSILENVQRATVSNPPAYGARIAAAVLGTPPIRDQWAKDLVTMSGRIRAMRQKLYDELVRLQTPGDWSHIVKQSGMFGYTGISKSQVQHLEGSLHVNRFAGVTNY